MIGERLFYGVAGAVFLLNMLLAAPGLTWLDGGEFVATVGPMGVSHPPGQPAYMVLATIAGLLPIGELAFRLSVFSAVCAAGAAGLTAALVSRGAARIVGLPGDLPLAGLVAGLLIGVSPALAMQGGRPELYALALLLGMMAVACIQMGGRRGLALAIVPLCVVGAVHHAMLVAAIPGLFLLALGRGSLRPAIVTTLALLPFGLGQFAWLPLRSATLPPFDFGAPRTLDRVIHAVTAAGYARSFRLDGAQLVRNVRQHLGVAWDDLGGLALVAAAVGAFVLWRARRRRALLAGAAFIVVGAAPTALQGIFSPNNPDAHGYLLGPLTVLAAAAGVGVWVLVDAARRQTRLAPWLSGALLLGIVGAPLLGTLGAANHSRLIAPRVLAAAVLDAAPPGAVLLLGGDSWQFPASAARYVERRRPDVHVLGLHMLDPVSLADARARGVPLPAVELPVTPPRGLMPEYLLLAILHAGVDVPVVVNDFSLPPQLLKNRVPMGLLHQVAGPLSSAPRGERDVVRVLDDVLVGPGWVRDTLGQEVVARRHMARGGYHLQRGDRDAALSLFARGKALTTDPWNMIHLAHYRLDTGALRPGPWPEDAAVEAAAARMLQGDLVTARQELDAVLAARPLHPGALLLAERLYSLGHYADTEASAP